MSDAPPPPPASQPPQPNDPKAAKAAAKAAKAHAKALRPWYKKKRVMIPLVLVVLIGLASAGGGGEDGNTDDEPIAADTGNDTSTDTDTSESAADESEPEDDGDAMVAMGEPAEDGQFQFVVNSLECGATSVGEEPFAEQTTGMFCFLDLTTTNTGDEAKTFSADSQTLIDDQGREFDYAFDATFAYDTENSFLEEINPGISLTGVLVFEVPADAVIVEANLSDSVFGAGGVRVAVVMS